MSVLDTSNEIITESREHILRIEINRPQKKNALTIAMYAAMADTIIQADEDSDIRVVFLHGTADCFTAGNDLQDFKDYKPDGEARPANPFLVAIRRAKKPMVAAVGGIAVGVGTTMLLHFDLVYAGESAQFRLPFVNLGLCPEAASSFYCPDLSVTSAHRSCCCLVSLFRRPKPVRSDWSMPSIRIRISSTKPMATPRSWRSSHRLRFD